MARKAGGLLATQALRSFQVGDIPPSTLAAKIVEHGSKPLLNQKNEDEDLFGKLLQEYLHDLAVEEVDLETNAKLILIVSEAGLDPLSKENPFARKYQLQQARDSIAVIRLTLERTPDIIFHHERISSSSISLPLFLVLVPRILSLWAKPHLNEIKQDFLQLFLACLSAPARSIGEWHLADAAASTIRFCIEDALDTLESFASKTPSRRNTFELAIPPQSAMVILAPESEETIVIPRDAQAHFTSEAEAALVVLLMIESLERTSGLNTDDSEPRLCWIADSLRRFCSIFNRQCEGPLLPLALQALSSFCSLQCTILTNRSPREISSYEATLLCEEVAVLLRNAHIIPSPSFQQAISKLLDCCIRQHGQSEYLRSAFQDLVIPTLLLLVSSDHWSDSFNQECKIAVCSAIGRFGVTKSMDGLPMNLTKFLNELKQTELTSASDQFELVNRLLGEFGFAEASDGTVPEVKRRRLDDFSTQFKPSLSSKTIVDAIMAKLSWPGQGEFNGLHRQAIDKFADLDKATQEEIMGSLGRLPCMLSLEAGGSATKPYCQYCLDVPQLEAHLIEPAKCEEVGALLSSLVHWAGMQRSKRLRVLSMFSLRQLINHCGHSSIVDLKKDESLGQWCLKSLQSSSRELRLAAARTLASFLKPHIAPHLRKANRNYAFEFLRLLETRQILNEQESLVFAWAQIARVCNEEELNIALLQLVELLGHPHLFIQGMAFDEILRLAEYKSLTVEELFRPFWRTIGIRVIKDLLYRPQKAQLLCDLLGITVTRLLLQTQTETIPYLISARNKEILERIATARNLTVQETCLQPSKNLAMILAHLLLQNFSRPDEEILALLCAAAPEFSETDIVELIRLEPVLVACEMFRVAGEQATSKKPEVHRAIATFMTFAAQNNINGKTNAKASKVYMSQFLETHVLGIMTHFSGIIDASRELQPLNEKRRCLRGMAEMLRLAGSEFNFGMAVPQVRACLQYALDESELCDEAFHTWVALLETVDKDDVENLLDHTFAVIIRTWSIFSEESQTRAHDLIGQLIKKYNGILKEQILSLPSLSSIPVLSKFEREIAKFRNGFAVHKRLEVFTQRCSNENKVVVEQALVELLPYLKSEQKFIHDSVLTAQTIHVVSALTRSLLDAATRFLEDGLSVSTLCAQCLGVIGCLDPNRIETKREKHEVIILSNFERLDETIDFVTYFLENVLVKAFRAAPNGRVQNFLAYAIQELLKHCEFKSAIQTPKSSQAGPQIQRWFSMSEAARNTLIPYLNTRFVLARQIDAAVVRTLPIFKPTMTHSVWLRDLVLDLLHRGKGDNAQLFFPVLSRIIRGHDISIPSFLLPFTMLNVVLGGTENEIAGLETEMLSILQIDLKDVNAVEALNVKQCSEVLDYFSRWLQQKHKTLLDSRVAGLRGTVNSADFDELKEISQISRVEQILSAIPSSVIAQRATECQSYPRALFHWEAYIREKLTSAEADDQLLDEVYQRMQKIYAALDEPDGIEGISHCLHIVQAEQQVLEYKMNRRWEAAQSWYETELLLDEDNSLNQLGLLACLKESEQQDAILRFVESKTLGNKRIAPEGHLYAVEACWSTGQWNTLKKVVKVTPDSLCGEFNLRLAECFLSLQAKDNSDFLAKLTSLRESVTKTLTATNTSSLVSAHSQLLKLHALFEVEQICLCHTDSSSENADMAVETALKHLASRLDIVGTFISDKQYLLGIRRAAMLLSNIPFSNQDHANMWLDSARIARKTGLINVAYRAINRASKFDEEFALIEQARLLWKDNNQKKAIQNLESAISVRAFGFSTTTTNVSTLNALSEGDDRQQNVVLQAKAELLLARWKDQAGQAGSDQLVQFYHKAVRGSPYWEKGHYYLGRYYNKILENGRLQPVAKQSYQTKTGETEKLVIENYLRSLCFGAKYYYQTIPKILTLWLDFGQEVSTEMSKGCAHGRDVGERRKAHLESMNKHIRKYLENRVSPWALYTAFPQIMSRIGHPHAKVWDILSSIIVRVASTYPQQALWSVLASAKSTASNKASRSQDIMSRLRQEPGRKSSIPPQQLRFLIQQGQKLTEALLNASEVNVDRRAVHVSLTRDLFFNSTKLAPCGLIVPIEGTMTAVLPTTSGMQALKTHKPFPYGNVTIESFADDVLVLSSLQRPRKINVRGSDGRLYGLLCKPKDDLRKDQRLMEFNAMIERSLKGDVEASKRQLYIKTYAVTPLNEECGIIEWVEGLKPIRDIILSAYKTKGVRIDYAEIKKLLDEACSELPRSASIFTDKILPRFPPVLHEWFIEMFPEPDAWYAARLRYSRSCAVMSIVGHVLGLGDRHGENILLEAVSGGVFHVDFNCLFDKGLTFEKPEKVPFRLTHNLEHAFGSYGIEGPFRKSAEVTLKVLRQNQDTLMTILETFLYDPTADFLGTSKKKRTVPGVPETPQEVLDGVRSKLNGLMHGEKVPMGIEGYVESLINMAISPQNLAEMYIGWCAFF